MSITAIVPLKALSQVKRRLAGRLDHAQRRELMARMFAHVVAVCADTPGVADVRAVVGDEAGAQRAQAAGIAWVLEPSAGLNAAVTHATGAVPADGAALVVVADLPRVTVADLTSVLAAGGHEPAVVVAATTDGGTGALLRRPPSVIAPAFGPRSAAAHLDAGQKAGVRTAMVGARGLAVDLDRPADLDGLRGVPPPLGDAGP